MSTDSPSDETANPRLEIDDMAKNQPEQFSLVVHSLEILCPRPLPCFGISGIETASTMAMAQNSSSTTEEITQQNSSSLRSITRVIVQEWLDNNIMPDDGVIRPKWEGIAEKLRLPFWDRNADIPNVIVRPNLITVMPNNTSTTHENLFRSLMSCLPRPEDA